MKVRTFTVVVGTYACNAKCPYCVSKMTPKYNEFKWTIHSQRNFLKAARYAKDCGAEVFLITGKGEPTLDPDAISYCLKLSEKIFPIIELQTNGVNLFDYELTQLKKWYMAGLTTVAISIAHYNVEKNFEIVQPNALAYDPWQVVQLLHDKGLSVRINCVLIKGYIDSAAEVETLIQMCADHKVEQLTIRNIEQPNNNSSNPSVSDWVERHRLNKDEYLAIRDNLWDKAELIMELPHGAAVYDYEGQNVCLNNCLTSTKNPENMRQLIYFPDGHLRYDWKYPGAIIF